MAAELGEAIAAEHWGLVYGGGGIGLMGEVARGALAAGGHVTGVIPHRLATREIALDGVTELIRTDTMRERKGIMDARSDGFIVLPGGIGTLEELLEIITLRQLGYHERPIVLLDPRGFWEPLVTQLDRIVAEGLAQPQLRELWAWVDTVPDAIETVRRELVLPHVAEGDLAAADGAPGQAREAAEGASAEDLEVVEAPPQEASG